MSRLTRLANLDEPLVLRRLAPGRLSSVRDTTRLRDEVVAKLRAVRTGTVPAWSAVFLAKPLASLMLPMRLRDPVRAILARRSREPCAADRGVHG
jgi:hypothetical protein